VDSELSDPGKSVFSRSARGGIEVETLAKATFSILPGVIRGYTTLAKALFCALPGSQCVF
ncbi:hypothetical protein, partial [uncultured Murdochiella sp.]|uniref:hypothetical protein n=1 Tax=uncultured Murdochiella sp. TaxID=1586095 RepID=UPI002804A6A5